MLSLPVLLPTIIEVSMSGLSQMTFAILLTVLIVSSPPALSIFEPPIIQAVNFPLAFALRSSIFSEISSMYLPTSALIGICLSMPSFSFLIMTAIDFASVFVVKTFPLVSLHLL